MDVKGESTPLDSAGDESQHKGENEGPQVQVLGAYRNEIDTHDLFEKDVDQWKVFPVNQRTAYLDHIEKFYKKVADDILNMGNYYASKYNKCNRRHKRWRMGIILLSGVLAVLNAAIAFIASSPRNSTILIIFSQALPLLAAVWAAGLVILNKLENFLNYQGIAQTYRRARDLLIDNYRENEMLWQTYVFAFGNAPEACVNANRLYRRIVSKDKKIREHLKELMEKQFEG